MFPINKHNKLLRLTLQCTILIQLISSLMILNLQIAKCQPHFNQLPRQSIAASSLLLLASKSRNLVLDPPQVLDGSAATTATVAATAPSTTTQPPPVPDFEAPIGNQTVAVGRDAQLSCRIKDLGNFKTAWLRVEDKGILTIHNNVITRNYRFGLNSDDGKEFVLTIKNVQPSDKGGYMCQINSVPMKFAVGYLDVLTPPAFAEQVDPAQALSRQDSAGAQDQASAIASAQGLIVVTEGTNTTLTCKAGGHPTPEITWRREDGQAILVDGPNSEGVAKVDGPNLTLGPVHRLQAGAYLCIASNGVQPSASRRQVLDVQFSPIIRLPETEVGAPLNEPELTLNCYIELNPLGSYHWVRMPSTRIGGSTMSISSGGGSSSGNSGGSRLLSMQEGVAQGSTSTEVIAAALSDDASLIEHDELTNSDKFEIVIKQMAPDKMHMALTVRKLERADFAWYKCIVKNSLGIQSSAIKVYETQAAAAAPQPSSTGGFFGSLGGTSRQSADTQLNDQASKPAKQHGPILNPRAHTRSSWIQRSASGGSGGSRGGSMADDSASSSASQAIASPVMSHANSHLLIMLSLLLLSITILSLFPPQ